MRTNASSGYRSRSSFTSHLAALLSLRHTSLAPASRPCPSRPDSCLSLDSAKDIPSGRSEVSAPPCHTEARRHGERGRVASRPTPIMPQSLRASVAPCDTSAARGIQEGQAENRARRWLLVPSDFAPERSGAKSEAIPPGTAGANGISPRSGVGRGRMRTAGNWCAARTPRSGYGIMPKLGHGALTRECRPVQGMVSRLLKGIDLI